MDPLRELLATDQRQALEFFFLGLQDVSEPTVDRQELLYNAAPRPVPTRPSSLLRDNSAPASARRGDPSSRDRQIGRAHV